MMKLPGPQFAVRSGFWALVGVNLGRSEGNMNGRPAAIALPLVPVIAT
jgi:hypothetical protein